MKRLTIDVFDSKSQEDIYPPTKEVWDHEQVLKMWIFLDQNLLIVAVQQYLHQWTRYYVSDNFYE